MTITLWIISLALITFAVYMAVMNWAVFFNNHILRKKWTSAVPLIGGLVGAIGIVLLPACGSWKYAWLPFILDWGSIPVIVVYLFSKLKNK
jgi:hypothetical protein